VVNVGPTRGILVAEKEPFWSFMFKRTLDSFLRAKRKVAENARDNQTNHDAPK